MNLREIIESDAHPRSKEKLIKDLFRTIINESITVHEMLQDVENM